MLDIICPSVEKDFEQFKILYSSLEDKIMIDCHKYIIVPSESLSLYKKLLSNNKTYEVVDENELFQTKIQNGWYKQQILKLLSFKLTNKKFILSLDSDCVAAKKIFSNSLIVNERAFIQYEESPSDGWYQASSKILNMPVPNKKVGVTPFIFSRDILCDLMEYLNNINYSPSKLYSVVNYGLLWSEYTLYHIYLNYVKKIDDFHCNGRIYGNSIWYIKQIPGWEFYSSPDIDHFFTVIQSNMNLPMHWVRKKVGLNEII